MTPIVDVRLKLADTVKLSASYAKYPFVLQIPSWLPSSLVLTHDKKDTDIIVEYYLVAEYIPLDPKNYINCALTPPARKHHPRWGPYWLERKIELSRISGTRLVNIYAKPLLFKPEEVEVPLSVKVGGLFGFGMSTSDAKVRFPKQHFHFGETIKINFSIDNTDCSKAVSKVKVKLYRRFTTRTTLYFDPQICFNDDYILAQKYPGCPAKQKSDYLECTFTFPIEEDVTEDSKSRLHVDQLHNLLAPSFSGKNFAVEYYLKCFIKYDSWNEFGEGKSIIFPI